MKSILAVEVKILYIYVKQNNLLSTKMKLKVYFFSH